jgi:hypothetical protein
MGAARFSETLISCPEDLDENKQYHNKSNSQIWVMSPGLRKAGSSTSEF